MATQALSNCRNHYDGKARQPAKYTTGRNYPKSPSLHVYLLCNVLHSLEYQSLRDYNTLLTPLLQSYRLCLKRYMFVQLRSQEGISCLRKYVKVCYSVNSFIFMFQCARNGIICSKCGELNQHLLSYCFLTISRFLYGTVTFYVGFFVHVAILHIPLFHTASTLYVFSPEFSQTSSCNILNVLYEILMSIIVFPFELKRFMYVNI